MARQLTRFLLCVLIVVLLFGISEAAHHSCSQFFVKQQNVVLKQRHGYYANQFVVPQVYYQAGRDVELDAITEKILKRLELRLQAQEQQQSHAPQRQPVEANAEATGAIKQHCAQCHSGATPKKGLVYDGVTPMTGDQIAEALKSIRDKTMPKDHEMPDADKGPWLSEALDLHVPAEQ